MRIGSGRVQAAVPRLWEAGVWDRNTEDADGLRVKSRHTTKALALKQARRYAAQLYSDGPSTGGALSWSGGVRGPDGVTVWVRHDGEIMLREG
jgi:hypothetical protein